MMYTIYASSILRRAEGIAESSSGIAGLSFTCIGGNKSTPFLFGDLVCVQQGSGLSTTVVEKEYSAWIPLYSASDVRNRSEGKTILPKAEVKLSSIGILQGIIST